MNESADAKNQKPTDEWSDLAAKAQDGDKRAYNKLLTELVPYIKGAITGRVSNQEWIEDITQEVLISVHKSLHTYSNDRPFKPWLSAIISFRKTDFLRKYYSRRGDKKTTLDSVDFQREHVTNPIHSGELKDIETALSKIPDKQRQLYQLVKIEGYTSKEAAKEMKMTVSAVKVSVHRTGQKLKKLLEA